MFEHRPTVQFLGGSLSSGQAPTPEALAYTAAQRLYNNVEWKARLRRYRRMIRRKIPALKDFNQLLNDGTLCQGHYAGIQTIPVINITGSYGRANDFDSDFLPRNYHDRRRWMNIALVVYLGVGLPPVDVVQVGDDFFVKDGHHRVSVARAIGQKFIEAEVTVYEIAVLCSFPETVPTLKKAHI